jgi:D-galactarolactone isomerase
MTTAPLLPPGACDCHIHVFEDSYPLAPTATFKPPHAPASAYQRMAATLGLSRVVVVQPTGYAFDNRCTLQAMAQIGTGARGIAVVPPEVTPAELERLDAAGVRGVRFMMLPGGVLPWDALEIIAAKIAPFGWNINLQLDGCTLPVHAPMLAGLPARLVIDHIGKFLSRTTPDSEAFASLRRLLDTGRCWVKLSAPYESSKSGPPAYEDAALLARALADRYPARCLWASNWPHPNVRPEPDNASLLAWALACMPEPATRHRVLVDNPAELYGF